MARFCSMKNEYNTIYSQLTNTAINKKNVGVDLAKITQMIDDVFKRLKSEGINTDLIWKKIDNLCILTVIFLYPSLRNLLFLSIKKSGSNESLFLLAVSDSTCVQVLSSIPGSQLLHSLDVNSQWECMAKYICNIQSYFYQVISHSL